jgi:hypothetical protein
VNTIRPGKDKPLLMRVNGDVLEIFRLSDCLRYHVSFIKTLELKTDKKGSHALDINLDYSYSYRDIPVDEDAVQKVTSLIAEVERAKAEFRLD